MKVPKITSRVSFPYLCRKPPLMLAWSAVISNGTPSVPVTKTSTALSVTDKGKQFFDSASGGKTAGSKQSEPLYAVSAVPIKPQVIEITNITDGDGGSKIVEYQWNWDPKAQPQEVQDLLLANQPANRGKVVVKMDASGWQIVKFE